MITSQHVVQVLGVLNTVTGHIETCAKLRKFFGVPKPRARVAATLPRNYLQSLKQLGRVGGPAGHPGVGNMFCQATRLFYLLELFIDAIIIIRAGGHGYDVPVGHG